jgi:hypothetical protein
VRYRLQVRLTPADVGKRVVIRWRRPGPGGRDEIADVLGILEQAGAGSFAVRTREGTLVIIPAGRALAGKVVPPPPAARHGASPKPS